MSDTSLSVLEQLYFKVAEAMPFAIVIIDRKGLITLFNLRAELLFGYAREEVLGKTLRMLLPENLGDVHDEHVKRYFQNPTIREMGVSLVLHGRHRDGDLFPVKISLGPIPVDGAGIFSLAVIQRIEEADATHR